MEGRFVYRVPRAAPLARALDRPWGTCSQAGCSLAAVRPSPSGASPESRARSRGDSRRMRFVMRCENPVIA